MCVCVGRGDRLHCLSWVVTSNIGSSFARGESNATHRGPQLLISPIRPLLRIECQFPFRGPTEKLV